MTSDLAALAVIALWLVLIYLTHYASNRDDRRELWRSVMAGLVGLSVRASKTKGGQR